MYRGRGRAVVCRAMRILIAAAAAVLCVALAARADDTKPPQISDVKAGTRGSQVQVEARITDETGVLSAICHHRAAGGRVEDSPMVKNDFDDVFRVSFAGGPDTEYWIEASDLLGNGPATYGSSSKAFAVGGPPAPGKAVSSAEPPPKKQQEPRRPREHAAARPQPLTVEHSRPGTQPPEGRDFTIRSKIHSESPLAVAMLQARPQGTTTFISTKMTQTEGDTWEAQIPASMARGNVEYYIAVRNDAGQVTRQGDAGGKGPYVVSFKSSGGTATSSKSSGAATSTAAAKPPAPMAAAEKPSGPFVFTDNPPSRLAPGRPILLRVQVVPPTDNGEMPDRVAILWRGNDAQDQLTDMVEDKTGGWGGYKAELPPQEEGAIFFQVVACDASATKCGVDTGSKRKWHATSIATQPSAAKPLPLDAVSSKAPPTLPE